MVSGDIRIQFDNTHYFFFFFLKLFKCLSMLCYLRFSKVSLTFISKASYTLDLKVYYLTIRNNFTLGSKVTNTHPTSCFVVKKDSYVLDSKVFNTHNSKVFQYSQFKSFSILTIQKSLQSQGSVLPSAPQLTLLDKFNYKYSS